MDFPKEKEHIWKKIVEIERNFDTLKNEFESFENELPDVAKTAIQASKKTSEYRNRAEKTLSEVTVILNEISNKAIEFEQLLESSSDQTKDICNIRKKSSNLFSQFIVDVDSLREILTSTEDIVNDLTILVGKKPSLDSAIVDIESDAEDSKTNSSRIKGLYNQSLKIKQEFDELRDEIFGYQDEDETEIQGLSDKLNAAYKDTESSIKNLSSTTSTEIEFLEKRIQEIEEKSDARFNQFIIDRDKTYKDELSKIKSLMPAALTTGLSHAYEEKVKAEKEDLKKHKTAFANAIKWLSAVSIIPVGLSSFRLIEGHGLVSVLTDMPYLVSAVLPIYIPVFWLAYSANKSVKLSKRLIEEYTHKGVIGKTFEGLSTQIKDIEDHAISEELKIKLLYTMINANNENPGKLISDYNKSDHPLMDALDKSSQLSDAVNKLSQLPGFSNIAKKLDDTAKKMVDRQAKKVEQGLSEIDLNSKSNKEKETA